MKKPTIILDAGHGGLHPLTSIYVTAGKRSLPRPDGSVFYEGVNNREFLNAFKTALLSAGYTVKTTVDDYKDTPLRDRCSKTNQIHRKESSILISIHSNAAPKFNPQPYGHEVWTSPGETQSDVIAKHWITEFKKEFPSIKHRAGRKGDADKEAKFKMLTGTNCPAILLELLFFTNLKDQKLLESKVFQKQCAKVLVRALNNYIK